MYISRWGDDGHVNQLTLPDASAWSTPRDPVPHLLPVLRPLLQSTQTHRPSQVKNSSPVRQTYGLYGIIVILGMLGTRPEQHRTHNFGWLLAFEGSLFGGMSGPSRFLPCLCGTEYNTNRRCYYMVVLLFRRAIRGAGRRGKREPQSVPALNRDRPLIGTSPSYLFDGTFS